MKLINFTPHTIDVYENRDINKGPMIGCRYPQMAC